ncbi:hypothetical protein P3T35_003239 [Kitasatospora sp. GP30]|nr:hypothetical protein [Kitasatospora sp. GP30]
MKKLTVRQEVLGMSERKRCVLRSAPAERSEVAA